MTTLQDMIDMVEGAPDSEFYFELLVEWLTFDADMTHSEALRKATQVRAPALAALHLANATAALAPGGAFRRQLLVAIKVAVHAPHGWTGSVLVIEGEGIPRATQRPDGFPDAYWHGALVTVGACWVLEKQRTLREEWDAKRRAIGGRLK